MIFVTVGTHEQPFNRLVQCVDEMRKDQVIAEDVFIQSGYSTYEPRWCEWRPLIPYTEMGEKIREARIVITHGGPASFIVPLQMGKVPIVVPRRHEFGEHVNNHQLEFVQAVSDRMGTIIPVYDIDDLKDAICNYQERIQNMSSGLEGNNRRFNEQFECMVKSMFC